MSDQYGEINAPLLQALVNADAAASDAVICGGGRAVQSQHMPQEAIPYSFSVADLHGPDEDQKITEHLRWASGPATAKFEFERNHDYSRGLFMAFDQFAINCGTENHKARWLPVSSCIDEICLYVGGVLVETLKSSHIKFLANHRRRAGFPVEIAAAGDGADGDSEAERIHMQEAAQRSTRRYMHVPFTCMRNGRFCMKAVEGHRIEVEVKLTRGGIRSMIAIDEYTADAGGSESFKETKMYSTANSDAFNTVKFQIEKNCVALTKAIADGSSNNVAKDDLDSRIADLVIMPVMHGVTLCPLESLALSAMSATKAIVSADGSSVAGQGPLRIPYTPFADGQAYSKEFAKTTAAKSDVLIADSDLWSGVPLVGLLLEIEAGNDADDNDKALVTDSGAELIDRIELMSNNKTVGMAYSSFEATNQGSKSSQPLPAIMNGRRLAYLSFESVSESEKDDADGPSGLFPVSAATHPRVLIHRNAGCPAIKITVHAQQLNGYSLQDGAFGIDASYAR